MYSSPAISNPTTVICQSNEPLPTTTGITGFLAVFLAYWNSCRQISSLPREKNPCLLCIQHTGNLSRNTSWLNQVPRARERGCVTHALSTEINESIDRFHIIECTHTNLGTSTQKNCDSKSKCLSSVPPHPRPLLFLYHTSPPDTILVLSLRPPHFPQ